jgi:hypothetical protein
VAKSGCKKGAQSEQGLQDTFLLDLTRENVVTIVQFGGAVQAVKSYPFEFADIIGIDSPT